MGIDALIKFAQNGAEAFPDAPHNSVPLPRGSRVEDWLKLVNQRVVKKEGYQILKRRGGTASQKTLPGGADVLSLKGFISQIGASTKQYIAAHGTDGVIYLYDISADTITSIATGFSTTDPVQIICNDRFIYVFDFSYGASKYHDLLTGNTYDWLSYNYNYIYNHNWVGSETLSKYPDNPLDFAPGQKAICFPNFKDIGTTSVLQPGNGSIGQNRYATRIYQYKYTDGGQYIKDLDGNEYKENQIIIVPKYETLSYTVEGAGTAPELYTIAAPLKGNEIYYRSFIVTITDVNGDFIYFEPDDSSIEMPKSYSQLGASDPTATDNEEGRAKLIPYNTYLSEAFNDKPAVFKAAGHLITSQSLYEEPVFYKSLLLVDLLDDGSFTLSGKPHLVRLKLSDLYDDTQDIKQLLLSVNTHNADNIAKRYLYATKWLDNIEDHYRPSSERFPNSAYYLEGTEDLSKTIYTFTTPDRLLLEPISSRIPMAGGVLVAFGPDQLKLNSVEQFGGAMLIGGYEQARPTPDPYDTPSAATQGNIYTNIFQTSQLPENVALAFMFEYPDGKRSDIIETEKFLQKGFVSEETNISDCGQSASTATFEVTGPVTEDGDIEVTFDFSGVDINPYGTGSFTVTISLNTASHGTIENTAIAIQNGLNGDANFFDYFVATVDNSSDLVITCRGFGLDLNGITVNISPVLVAATGWIDPTANNVAGPENDKITIGANTTANITINDTDTIEQIVDKYVAGINGDATISADWTASKVDLGSGNFRCLITSDTPGSADNGVTISVDNTDVILSIETPTSGGSDGPGTTFSGLPDTSDGAVNPVGTPSEASITEIQNFLSTGSQDYNITIGGVVYANFTVDYSMSESDIMFEIVNVFAGADWSAALVPDGGVRITADDVGNTAFDDTWVRVESDDGRISDVQYTLNAPGRISDYNQIQTNGAGEACAPATVTLEPTANAIGTTENYTIALDGIEFFNESVASTDTLNEIATAIMTAARENADINELWQVALSANVLTFTHREYGTLGDGKSFTITPGGAGGLTFSDGSPSSGGSDEGATVPTSPASEIGANRVMIHSLNALVSKVYILGRVQDGGTTYHLIEEVALDSPYAHGMYLDLPNTSEQLTDILSSTFTPPATDEILTNPVFQNYVAAALPHQQVLISSQEQIADNATIQCLMKEAFDIDKTNMRYKVWVFTDQNIQMGYYVEQTTSTEQGQVQTDYTADFEVISEQLVIRSKFAKAKIKGSSFIQAQDGIYVLEDLKAPLIDNGDEPTIANNVLRSICYNEDANELWFVTASNEVLVYDFEYKTIRSHDYSNQASGVLKTATEFNNKVYAGFGNIIAITDDTSLNFDFVDDEIIGQATMKHLGDPTKKVKILEVVVAGVNETVELEIDLQESRLERNNTVWNPTFSDDFNTTPQNIYIHGASFQVHKMAVMPKIRFKTTGDTPTTGFISHLLIKYVLFDNKGKARI